MVVLYLVRQIEDEHEDYSFKDVPRLYKKRVREQLILNGNGHLANDKVKNYTGPRPPLTLETLLKKAEEEYEKQKKGSSK